MRVNIAETINQNKNFTPTPTYKDAPEFKTRAAKEKKAFKKLKEYESNGYDMSSHYKKFVTIGSDEGKLQRAWNGFRKFTSEGATTFTDALGGDSSEYRNNVKEIELRENNWKNREVKKNPKLYKTKDDVWNVSGGAGEVTPYVAGGFGMGASKAPTLGRKILGDVGRGAFADTVLASAQHGYKDNWDEEVAKEVGLGVAGQVVGTGFAHVFSKVKPQSKTTKVANNINKEYSTAGLENKAGDALDDEIVNKMMGNKSATAPIVKPKLDNKSIFGFDQVKEQESILGFGQKPNNIGDASVTNQNIKKIQSDNEAKVIRPIPENPNNIELPKMQEPQQKLPEVLPKDREEMQDLIKFVIKNNAEDEFLSKLPANAKVDEAREFLLNLKQPKAKVSGIEQPIVPMNKKEVPYYKSETDLETLDNNSIYANNKDMNIESTLNSQDVKLHSSATASGAGVGALTGATNDLDQDGKITVKDILLGAGIGAGATKTALVMKDTRIAFKATDTLKKVADTDVVDAFSGHKLYAKKTYMNIRENMISSKNAKMEDYAVLHEQLALLSDGARKNIHKFMSGDTSVPLTPALKSFANNYKTKIELAGKELVDLGILDAAQYEKFKGRYIHRVYEKDLTKSFQGAFQKGKTIQGVHTRGNEWTGTKTEYERLLKSGEIGDFFQGKIEARKMNNGQYKFTQDWTNEQRARWGEVEDVAYTLPETLMRMDEMVQHGKMLKGVMDDSRYVSDEAIDGYVHLQGKRFGALQGKYVPKDISSDITDFNNTIFGAEDGKIFSADVIDAYKTLSTFWKKSHTVYNPTAHVNNLLSNVTMQYMQGVNPITALKHAKDGATAHAKLGEFRKLTAKKLIGLSNEESQSLRLLEHDDDLKLYIQADRAGLFGRSKLNDILSQYVSPTTKKGKGGILKKVDEKASSYYQGEDNIMRFSLLKSLTNQGKDFDAALKEVNNTIPDYTKPMSRMARFGRASMLTPFISWTYYSTPIILRQMKERPGRALALMGALFGINKAFGIDPYDNKDIPQKNFGMKRIPIYKSGKEITTIKVDRWMPHNEILSPLDFVKNLYNGGAWKGGYEVLNNQNLYYGGKITHKEGARKAYDIFKHGSQQITPDIVDKAWNLMESAILSKKKRKNKPVIQPRTFTQEMFNMAGINTLTYDKKEQKKKAKREKIY